MSVVSPMKNNVSGDLTPLSDHVLVMNMEKGDKITAGGIIVLDDNGKERGIRPRWCQVYKAGKNIDYLKPGQWIYVEHGRWTWPVNLVLEDGSKIEVQRVDTPAILAVSDTCPL